MEKQMTFDEYYKEHSEEVKDLFSRLYKGVYEEFISTYGRQPDANEKDALRQMAQAALAIRYMAI